MKVNRPVSIHDLTEAERRFLELIREIQFGYLERLRIENGAVVLDPWPTVVKNLKFGPAERSGRKEYPSAGQLKREITDFFQFVRTVGSGELRRLEIRNTVPIVAEIEHWPLPEGGGGVEG